LRSREAGSWPVAALFRAAAKAQRSKDARVVDLTALAREPR
jgi:hypothetical protein